MMYIDYERANEIATTLKSSGEWDFELIEELCEKAGLKEEWNNSDRIVSREFVHILSTYIPWV